MLNLYIGTRHMDRKIIVLGIALVLAALILLSGCVTYDECDLNKDGKVSDIEKQKCEQQGNGAKGKCGDGICGAIEKEKGICPEDCISDVNCPTVVSPSPELEEQCKERGGFMKSIRDENNCTRGYECSVQISPTGDYSTDADGFLWGVEAAANADYAADVVNNVINTSYVKYRLKEEHMVLENGQYTKDLCLPSPSKCQDRGNLDEVAAFFSQNKWSMVPMLTPKKRGTNEDISDYIERAANFYFWFVDEYAESANIEFVEFENSPAHTASWENAGKDLAEINAKAYDLIKAKYPEIQVGTPGFEYQNDPVRDEGISTNLIEGFADSASGAKFDFWAFHGYPSGDPTTSGGGITNLYPPTRVPTSNKYAGIPGMLEIRELLNMNGFSAKRIIDTEHVNAFAWGFGLENYDGASGVFTNEDIDAAFTLQELILKKTLQDSAGNGILSGVISFKIRLRSEEGEGRWGTLRPDGSAPQSVESAALLFSKLDKYNYVGHISGAFDNENEAWVEKFSSDSGKELYIFFKPFEYRAGQTIDFDSKKADYTIALSQTPKSVTLTDMYGESTSIEPTKTIAIEAENSPKFLEIEYD
ncbi:MAG: hypothetical protein HYW05_01200 [Candidatus Diapherotrites archaeon]|nr:hypothetical protein [Candidatus Diapherotrites archaeon]